MKKSLLENFKSNAIPKEKLKKIKGGDDSVASALGNMVGGLPFSDVDSSKSNYIPGLSNISSK